MSLIFGSEGIARCECRNSHNSSSGRCTHRNVDDGLRLPSGAIYCPECYANCRKPADESIVNPRGMELVPAESKYNAHGQQYNVNFLIDSKIVGHTLRTFPYSEVLGIMHRWMTEGVQTC